MFKFQNIINTNIAIGLFGISYMENYNHWMNWKTNPDWRKTNYKTTLYKTLSDQSNNIDHYFSTYYNPLENDLIAFFNPIKYQLNDFIDKEWAASRHERFKEVLNFFPDTYEYYIMTRFDLSFDPNVLLNSNIDTSSINVTSRHWYGEEEVLCDYFYIFHISMLNTFKNFINNIPPADKDLCYYHRLHKHNNAPKFSYMIDGIYYSHNCPLWNIIR